MEEIKHYSRIGNSSFYRDIAMENYYQVNELNAQLIPLKTQREFTKSSDESSVLEYQIMKFERMMEMHATTTIIFSAMALEAFIYDYAAINLTDSFAKDHVDKIDFSSKWIVVPQLVTGNPFPKERQGFQQLKELIKLRNDLIHYKSTKVTSARLEQLASQETDLLAFAYKGIQAMDNLGKDLNSIDPNANAHFQLGIIPREELPWNQ